MGAQTRAVPALRRGLASRLAVPLFSVVTLLVLAAPPVAADVSARWAARPGTVAWMRTQPVGSQVALDAMMVDEIGDGYLIVREPFDQRQRVRVQANAHVRKWQSVEVTGTVALGPSSQAHLSSARVFAYTDGKGRVMPVVPKPLEQGRVSWQTIDVTSDEPLAPQPEPEPRTLTAEEDTVVYAKLNGGSVDLQGKLVIAAYDPDAASQQEFSPYPGQFFYIIDPGQRYALGGIKVVPRSLVSNLQPGKLVRVIGAVVPSGTTVAECYIDATEVTVGNDDEVPPAVGMTNLATAGGEFGQQQALYESSPQSVEGAGLNTVGNLVRVWGYIEDITILNDHVTYRLEDGSNLERAVGTETRNGLRVVAWADSATPSHLIGEVNQYGKADYVSFVGVVGAEFDANLPCPSCGSGAGSRGMCSTWTVTSRTTAATASVGLTRRRQCRLPSTLHRNATKCG